MTHNNLPSALDLEMARRTRRYVDGRQRWLATHTGTSAWTPPSRGWRTLTRTLRSIRKAKPTHKARRLTNLHRRLLKEGWTP